MSGEELWKGVAREAARSFALEIAEPALAALRAYAELLRSAAERTNLISAGSLREIAERHVLDSLAPTVFLRDRSSIVDLGSGAGLPGIPLAIALPESRLVLIESRRRRANFLRHVARTIELANVEIVEGRAEAWNGNAAAVVGRAIRFEELAEFAGRVLATGGSLLAMVKAEAPASRDMSFRETGRRAYRLPDGERHEVRLYERL